MKNPVLNLFLLALAIRLAYAFAVFSLNPAGIYMHDSWSYLNIAKCLFENNAYSQLLSEPFTPDSARTPLYPLFIYLFHAFNLDSIFIIASQAIMGAITAITTYYTVIIAGLKNKAAFAVGLVVALEPSSIFFSNVIGTEVIFCFWLSLSMYSFVRAIVYYETMSYVGFLIFLCLATLARPISIFLIPMMAFLFIFSRGIGLGDTFKNLVYFGLISAIFIGPWLIRNQHTFGKIFYSSISEVNLLFHTTAQLRSKLENRPQKEIEMEYRKKELGTLDFVNDSTAIGKFIDFARQESWRVIKENPKEFTKMLAKSSLYFFIKPLRSYFDYQLFNETQYDAITSVEQREKGNLIKKTLSQTSAVGLFIIAFQIVILLIIYLGIVLSLPYWWRHGKEIFFFMSVTILYFALISSLTEVDARFRMPVMPLLTILAIPFYTRFFDKPTNVELYSEKVSLDF